MPEMQSLKVLMGALVDNWYNREKQKENVNVISINIIFDIINLETQ
jgi:hypothetical protein